MIASGITIRHDQLTEGGPVHYGPMGITITERQGMKD